jgi:hypothetical protein
MAVIVLGRSHRDRDLLFWRLLDWPDVQTEIDDEISDQLKQDPGSRHDVAIMPQIPSSFGQNRGILFFAEDNTNHISAVLECAATTFQPSSNF